MLAGVLFDFVVAVWGYAQTEWMLVLPLLATFLVLLYYLSDRTGGLDLRFVAEGFVQALLAAVAAGFLAWLTWRVLDDALGRSLIAQMVSVGAAAAATVLAIVAAARAMNMPEMTAIVRVLSRRRGLR